MKRKDFNKLLEESRATIERTGVERSLPFVNCRCGRKLDVLVREVASEEAGRVIYEPPRIVESAECSHCGTPYYIYHKILREGNRVDIPR